jgi:hypothetical protein
MTAAPPFELAEPPSWLATFGRQDTLRRTLSYRWAPAPMQWAVWLMLNPSTARPDHHDQTTLRITHFTRAWGYGGWIIVNLYPFRAMAMGRAAPRR